MGAYTTTTTFASAIITKHKKELLAHAMGRMPALQFADKEHEGIGEDGTVRWNKLLRLPKITSGRTNEYDMFAASSARDMTTNYIECTPTTYEDAVGFTDKVDATSWITRKSKREEIANQIARTVEYQIIKNISTNFLRHRIDADATYQVNGTVDSGSTTTVVDDALTQTDDHWNGGFATFVNPEGPLYDTTQKISDFVASSDTLTMGTANHTPSTSTKYHLTVGTAVAATDVLSITGMIAASAILESMESPKWNGGTFRAFMHAAQHRDLWSDSTFLNSAIYDSSGRFKEYKVGRWFDIEFLISSELYREDVDGTENQSTGVVYVMPIFGKGTYGAVYWGNGDAKYGVDIMVTDKADSANLTRARNWISWKTMLGTITKRATCGVNLMTGATALPAAIGA